MGAHSDDLVGTTSAPLYRDSGVKQYVNTRLMRDTPDTYLVDVISFFWSLLLVDPHPLDCNFLSVQLSNKDIPKRAAVPREIIRKDDTFNH